MHHSLLTLVRRTHARITPRAGQLIGLALVGWFSVTTGGGFPH